MTYTNFSSKKKHTEIGKCKLDSLFNLIFKFYSDYRTYILYNLHLP